MNTNQQIFKPDKKYFDALAEKMVRLAKVSVENVAFIEINCGSDSALGTVILKSGEKLKV